MEKLVIKLKQSFDTGKYFLIALCMCCSFFMYSTIINAETCNHPKRIIKNINTLETCLSSASNITYHCPDCYKSWDEFRITSFTFPKHKVDNIKYNRCEFGTLHSVEKYCSRCGVLVSEEAFLSHEYCGK